MAVKLTGKLIHRKDDGALTWVWYRIRQISRKFHVAFWIITKSKSVVLFPDVLPDATIDDCQSYVFGLSPRQLGFVLTTVGLALQDELEKNQKPTLSVN